MKSLLLSAPARAGGIPASSGLLEGFCVHSLFMNHSLPSGMTFGALMESGTGLVSGHFIEFLLSLAHDK